MFFFISIIIVFCNRNNSANVSKLSPPKESKPQNSRKLRTFPLARMRDCLQPLRQSGITKNNIQPNKKIPHSFSLSDSAKKIIIYRPALHFFGYIYFFQIILLVSRRWSLTHDRYIFNLGLISSHEKFAPTFD